MSDYLSSLGYPFRGRPMVFAFENMLNNAKVYLPSGKDAEGNMSVLGILNLDRESAK